MPNNYALREVSDLTFYNLTTGKPFLYMDYALTSTNEHSGQTAYARGGKSAPKRQGFDGEKESTLKISTQVFDWRFISLLSGATVTTGATNIFKREVLAAADDGAGGAEITLTKTPVANTVTVFPLAKDAVDGEEETIAVTGSDVAITAGVVGNEYVAYYQFQSDATAEKISFKSNVFPATCKIVGDTLIKNQDGVNEPFQMIAHKAKAQPTFTLTQSSTGDPSTLDITFDCFATDGNDMIDYIRY